MASDLQWKLNDVPRGSVMGNLVFIDAGKAIESPQPALPRSYHLSSIIVLDFLKIQNSIDLS